MPRLRRIGIVAALIVGPIQWLSPIIATQVLHLTASEFGVVLGAFGLGAVAAAATLLRIDVRAPFRWLIVGGALVAAAAMASIGIFVQYHVAVVAMACLGVSHMSLFNAVGSLLQYNVDDRARGRVMSMWAMSFGAGAPLGILVQGTSAR